MKHKRGDTFRYAATIPFEKPDGYYADWELPRSQIRTLGGQLVAECQVSWLDAEKTRILNLLVPASGTQSWPIGKLKIDIQFIRTSDLETQSTGTAIFEVVDDVTKPIMSGGVQ